jgi:alpha-galactosidase
MLEVGNGGMTDTEMRSHFALWAVMASPLIMGNDLRSASSATLDILRNGNLVAINQDALARQAVQVSNDGTRRVLAKRLANGDVAVALFNQGASTTTVSTTAAAVGKNGTSFTLRDAWTNATSTSTGTISASVPAHGTVVYRVSGGTTTDPSTPSTLRLRSESSGRCLDLDNGTTTNGTGTLIWDCHGNANQQITQDGRALRILGKCLDVPPSAANGTRVQVWDCNGGTNQQWTFNGNGTVSNARFPSLCVDVSGGGTANGTAVILWSCHGGTNQRWSRS